MPCSVRWGPGRALTLSLSLCPAGPSRAAALTSLPAESRRILNDRTAERLGLIACQRQRPRPTQPAAHDRAQRFAIELIALWQVLDGDDSHEKPLCRQPPARKLTGQLRTIGDRSPAAKRRRRAWRCWQHSSVAVQPTQCAARCWPTTTIQALPPHPPGQAYKVFYLVVTTTCSSRAAPASAPGTALAL